MNANRIKLTRMEIQEQLQIQLDLIQSSIEDYNKGREIESLRLATNLRVLLHDKGSGKSLFKQLGLKQKKFYDSAYPYIGSGIGHSGLTQSFMGDKATKEVPLYDENPDAKWVDFNSWWNGIIIVDQRGKSFSRADIVLKITNQDGGGHVDPGIEEDYYHLSRKNSLGHFIGSEGNWRNVNHHLVSIRQIVHEVLKTLNPNYSYVPCYKGDNGYLMKLVRTKTTPVSRLKGRDRNKPCLCGSGKKGKKCCT